MRAIIDTSGKLQWSSFPYSIQSQTLRWNKSTSGRSCRTEKPSCKAAKKVGEVETLLLLKCLRTPRTPRTKLDFKEPIGTFFCYCKDKSETAKLEPGKAGFLTRIPNTSETQLSPQRGEMPGRQDVSRGRKKLPSCDKLQKRQRRSYKKKNRRSRLHSENGFLWE